MTRTPLANVNLDLLVWARESMRLTLEVAAKKIGVKPDRRWMHRRFLGR